MILNPKRHRGGSRQVIKSPSLWQTASEVRWLREVINHLSISRQRLMTEFFPGDGRPILVIPGFLCSDASTWALRRFLRHVGYRTYRWKQGLNLGQRPGVRTRLLHRINEIHRHTGRTVTLIGWSLGGVYAREIASVRPDLIREVITLGSPWHGSPELTPVWRAYRWLNRKHISNGAAVEIDHASPPVPCLSIYSKGDGIVPWGMCLPKRGLQGRSLEVVGSHIGLIANNDVMTALGKHLGRSLCPTS